MKQVTRSRRGAVGGSGLASARRRFERRAARARRRPWLIALVATLVVMLAGGAVWVGWFSSLLLAERVDVRGVGSSEAGVVREVAAVPLGGPLMRVDTGAATDRIERDRRWVGVSVARRLPHSVVIEVTPRVAVLVVRSRSGALELHDHDGVAFRTVDEAPDGLPLVSSTSGAATPGGQGRPPRPRRARPWAPRGRDGRGPGPWGSRGAHPGHEGRPTDRALGRAGRRGCQGEARGCPHCRARPHHRRHGSRGAGDPLTAPRHGPAPSRTTAQGIVTIAPPTRGGWVEPPHPRHTVGALVRDQTVTFRSTFKV